jgi:hypothetical protein
MFERGASIHVEVLLLEEYCIKKIPLLWLSANTSNVTSSTLPVKLWCLDTQNENIAPKFQGVNPRLLPYLKLQNPTCTLGAVVCLTLPKK